MKLSMKEKKVLYAFACPNHHNTVTRLKWLTALTVDPQAKHRMLELARKMETEMEERWYTGFYHQLRAEMDEYYRAKRRLRLVKENTASIYTFNADLKRRLAEFSRKYPQLCRLERSTTEGSVTYVMDKSRLSIRLVPPYSEERLAAAREYAKQHGFQVLQTDKKSA